MPYARTPASYSGYDQGYDQGYGMYDQGMGGYDQGYADPGYGGYGGAPPAIAGANPAGMTMVPMMLPTGQASTFLSKRQASKLRP